MENFLNFIRNYINPNLDAEKSISEVSKYLQLEKNTILLEEGKTCKHLYFLVSGSVRTYYYLKGKDITHWVYPSNSLFTSWGSYILQNPSSEYIETTDDCELISISYDDWQNLYKKHPELERFGRLIMEEQMALIDEFYKGYYFLTAKEKYELLINAFPQITQIANLGHIASMLGISQETLSRIRGK